jgi:murein DD-endopeptidase MepM/ murein hydrolase activator NlpD
MRTLCTTGIFFIASLFPIFAYAVVVPMDFPLDVPSQFRDDFGEPRAGHAHKGIDIIAPKMSPILSSVDGYVRHLEIPEASWGYEIGIAGDDGYFYNYLHINNDTPATDDGA